MLRIRNYNKNKKGINNHKLNKMSRKLKLYIHVGTAVNSITTLSVEKLKSFNGLLDFDGIMRNMQSQAEGVRNGEKYVPLVQNISLDKFDECVKEIKFKVKTKIVPSGISVYTDQGVKLVNLIPVEQDV